MAGGVLCHSVMVVVGGTPSNPSWGVPHIVMVRGTYQVMIGGTPSSHGGGTNPHLGWGDMGWVGGLCYSVMMVVGGDPSSPRWGVPYPVMMGGTTPRMGDTIPGMGWVGVPHPSSWLSTLARGYLPWLGGTYLGQEDTSSNVGTYSQGIYPLPRVHTPPSPSTLTRRVPTLDRGVRH